MDLKYGEEVETSKSSKSSIINGSLSASTLSSHIDSTSVQYEVAGHLKVIQEAYSRRISSIENNHGLSESQKAKQKCIALESYVKQLYEQNDYFASTMVNLEKECEQRVKQMEKRLKKSAKTTMEAVINMHEYEKETKRLVEERMYIESLHKDNKHNLTALKVENGFLRDQNSNLYHDVQALLHVIHHARSTGHWELNCVTFCEVTPEQVFGPIQSISNNTSETESQQFRRNSKKGKANYSPVHLHSSYLPRCASLPEIGNIYNFSQAVHKSNSYDINSSKRLLGVKLSNHKRTSAGNIVRTPELLNDVSCVKNLKERLCNRKSQSEPHLFMFDGNIYKYTPCEPIIQKPSNNVLNENYLSSLPPYQSIDLKFPTEGSTLKINVWNNLKSGSYLDDQENSYLKDNSLNSSCCSEGDINRLNEQMQNILREHSRERDILPLRISVGLQAETATTTAAIQVIPHDFESYLKDCGHHTDMQTYHIQGLKEDLHKAMVHTEQKSVLLSELQNHVNSAFAEVEKKNKMIDSLEQELKLSRDDCQAYKEQVVTVTKQLERVTQDSCAEIEDLKRNVKQQSLLIRNLQDALVQTKRVLESHQSKVSTKFPENGGGRRSSRNQNNIIDI